MRVSERVCERVRSEGEDEPCRRSVISCSTVLITWRCTASSTRLEQFLEEDRLVFSQDLQFLAVCACTYHLACQVAGGYVGGAHVPARW